MTFNVKNKDIDNLCNSLNAVEGGERLAGRRQIADLLFRAQNMIRRLQDEIALLRKSGAFTFEFQKKAKESGDKGLSPTDAWGILSANLAHLVRIRKCMGDPIGYTHAETEAEVIAFQALKEMEERLDPKPIPLDELAKMHGIPVYIEDWYEPFHGWELSEDAATYLEGDSRDPDCYGVRWSAYRYERK